MISSNERSVERRRTVRRLFENPKTFGASFFKLNRTAGPIRPDGKTKPFSSRVPNDTNNGQSPAAVRHPFVGRNPMARSKTKRVRAATPKK